MKNLLAELGISTQGPMILKSDNLGATFLASNVAWHTKLKRVAMDLKYVRERVEPGSVLLTKRKMQKAYVLTKTVSQA